MQITKKECNPDFAILQSQSCQSLGVGIFLGYGPEPSPPHSKIRGDAAGYWVGWLWTTHHIHSDIGVELSSCPEGTTDQRITGERRRLPRHRPEDHTRAAAPALEPEYTPRRRTSPPPPLWGRDFEKHCSIVSRQFRTPCRRGTIPVSKDAGTGGLGEREREEIYSTKRHLHGAIAKCGQLVHKRSA